MGALFQTILGSASGVFVVVYARGAMKQPYFFRPYEHILAFGVGAWMGYGYHKFTMHQGEMLIKNLEARNIDGQFIRYLLPRI